MRTHRCEKSLKSKSSIRYGYSHDWFRLPSDTEGWQLYKKDYNEYSNHDTMIHVCEIHFCPFCGEKLNP